MKCMPTTSSIVSSTGHHETAGNELSIEAIAVKDSSSVSASVSPASSSTSTTKAAAGKPVKATGPPTKKQKLSRHFDHVRITTKRFFFAHSLLFAHGLIILVGIARSQPRDVCSK